MTLGEFSTLQKIFLDDLACAFVSGDLDGIKHKTAFEKCRIFIMQKHKQAGRVDFFCSFFLCWVLRQAEALNSRIRELNDEVTRQQQVRPSLVCFNRVHPDTHLSLSFGVLHMVHTRVFRLYFCT